MQKAGEQVLVNVQLIDARSDRAPVGQQSTQRTLKNVFGVEGEVAEKIANALKAKLSPAEAGAWPPPERMTRRQRSVPARPSIRPTWPASTSDPTSVKAAIALYRQAVARAPDFALARARLS